MCDKREEITSAMSEKRDTHERDKRVEKDVSPSSEREDQGVGILHGDPSLVLSSHARTYSDFFLLVSDIYCRLD